MDQEDKIMLQEESKAFVADVVKTVCWLGALTCLAKALGDRQERSRNQQIIRNKDRVISNIKEKEEVAVKNERAFQARMEEESKGYDALIERSSRFNR